MIDIILDLSQMIILDDKASKIVEESKTMLADIVGRYLPLKNDIEVIDSSASHV